MKPFWMFGCEMGTNEYGVTMGNEAVYTKEPLRKKGLLGMDMMTLALQRSKTAKEALDTIISLLEEHGQGGNCGYLNKLNYHNSFIIADLDEAWVLETSDRFWIAEKVKDVRSISNTISIEKEFDLVHPELIQYAVERGYCKTEDEFNFAKNFIPKLNIYQIFAHGKVRQTCTTNRLKNEKGKITPEIIMSVLRDHNLKQKTEEKWAPHQGSLRSPCCTL